MLVRDGPGQGEPENRLAGAAAVIGLALVLLLAQSFQQTRQELLAIHRIGQASDVLLINLVARGTVEERILELLEAKINLFELVVGELDMILGRVEEDFEFESAIFKAHVASADDAEFADRLEVLGDGLAQARRGYLASREGTDRLVGEQQVGQP